MIPVIDPLAKLAKHNRKMRRALGQMKHKVRTGEITAINIWDYFSLMEKHSQLDYRHMARHRQYLKRRLLRYQILGK